MDIKKYYDFLNEDFDHEIFRDTEYILLNDLKKAIEISFDLDVHLCISFLLTLQQKAKPTFSKLNDVEGIRELMEEIKEDYLLMRKTTGMYSVPDEKTRMFFERCVDELNWESTYFIYNLFESIDPTFFDLDFLKGLKEKLNKKMEE